MIDNFYDYVKKKYYNINTKITKRKYKLKYLKQNGGTLSKEITDEINRLDEVREQLAHKLRTAERVNFPEIIANIKGKIKSLNDFIKSQQLTEEPENLQSFLNELTGLEQFVKEPTGAYWHIDYKKIPNMIIAPPIPDDKIKKTHEEFLTMVETNMKEVDASIDANDDRDRLLFTTKMSDLQSQIDSIPKKITAIEQLNIKINKKIKEMEKYTEFDFDIPSKAFVSSIETGPEQITIKELAGISVKTDLTQSEIDGRILAFDETLKILPSEKLVSPDFTKDTFGGAPTQIYYIQKANMDTLIGDVYIKWLENIEEAKIKLIEDQQRLERQRIEDQQRLERQRIEDQQRLERLERENREIEPDVVNINAIIEKINIKLINERLGRINTIFESKKKLLNEEENTSKIIEYEQINGLVDDINKQVTKIKNEIDIIKSNSTTDKKQKILIILEKIQGIKQFGDEINKTIQILEEFNKQIDINNKLNEIIEVIKEIMIPTSKYYKESRIKLICLINFYFSTKKTLGKKIISDISPIKFVYNDKKELIEFVLNPDTTFTARKLDEFKQFAIDNFRDASVSEKIILTKIKDINNIKQIERLNLRDPELIELSRLYGEYKQLIKQYGGGVIDWQNYYQKMEQFNQELTKYKEEYNNFNQISKKFNIMYIQLYHHQLFISNYIQVILLKKNYSIYQNISRGMVNYYYKEIKRILDLFKDTKNMSKVISYFYKNHYFNIKILEEFLRELDSQWKGPRDSQVESEKNISRLILFGELVTDNTFKLRVFLFNMFKNIIDAYLSTNSSPFAVYLRINDRQTFENKTFVKDDRIGFKGLFKADKLLNCKKDDPIVIKTSPPDDLKNLSNDIEVVKTIEFKEIYDPEGFTDNSTLALYMGLPNFLSNQKSILIITYGYSGVGKTFTLFGKTSDDGSKQLGLLQKALGSITEKEEIRMRTFEIYGVALPYKSYWQNKRPEEYNHSIYTYKHTENLKALHANITGSGMTDYLKEIEILNDFGSTYTTISQAQIDSFDKFIESVDVIREYEGRIKKTVNNPSSSRSIMVYEFKIKLSTNKFVSFIVMDLPGKENVKTTYVYNGLDNGLTKVGEDPSTSAYQPILNEVAPTAVDYGISIDHKYKKYNDSIKAALFLNPMFISIFPDIAEDFISFIKTKYNKLYTDDFIVKTSPLKIMFKYVDNMNLKELVDTPQNEITKAIATNRYDSEQNYKVKFMNCFIASELFRYILKSNHLEILIDFYNDKILKTHKQFENKNYGALSFEAFYINENILGLVDILGKRLKEGYIKDSSLVAEEYFKINTQFRDKSGTPVNDESTAQTYFLRNLLRNDLSPENPVVVQAQSAKKLQVQPVVTPVYLLSNIEDKENFLTTSENYNKFYNPSDNGTKASIKDWIEKPYDYNKSFVDKEQTSPIETFMESYFKIVDRSKYETSIPSSKKNIIDNIYLFYVVSNDIDTKSQVNKCANQIKLIKDSKMFIDIINSWNQ